MTIKIERLSVDITEERLKQVLETNTNINVKAISVQKIAYIKLENSEDEQELIRQFSIDGIDGEVMAMDDPSGGSGDTNGPPPRLILLESIQDSIERIQRGQDGNPPIERTQIGQDGNLPIERTRRGSGNNQDSIDDNQGGRGNDR